MQYTSSLKSVTWDQFFRDAKECVSGSSPIERLNSLEIYFKQFQNETPWIEDRNEKEKKDFFFRLELKLIQKPYAIEVNELTKLDGYFKLIVIKFYNDQVDLAKCECSKLTTQIKVNEIFYGFKQLLDIQNYSKSYDD